MSTREHEHEHGEFQGCGPAHHHDPANDPAYVHEQTGVLIDAFMTTEPLESLVDAARNATMTEAMGALVTFDGVVRDHDGGARVQDLDYTAHPSADQEIKRVATDVLASHPHARLWCAHRTGHLKIGESAFVVLAASSHRKQAFDAASELADRVKSEVPIWKEQTRVDGSAQWVGLE